MKNEILGCFESDVKIIEKRVTLYNCLNPDDYMIEVLFNGCTEHIIQVNDLQKAFFVFDSIRNSIKFEVAQYENKVLA
jgi:hypothetical protein